METTREQLKREEIYEPAIADQIDNEPESLAEALEDTIVAAENLYGAAKENADYFRDMFSSAEKLSKAIGLK